jgi:hypothetical protein
VRSHLEIHPLCVGLVRRRRPYFLQLFPAALGDGKLLLEAGLARRIFSSTICFLSVPIRFGTLVIYDVLRLAVEHIEPRWQTSRIVRDDVCLGGRMT